MKLKSDSMVPERKQDAYHDTPMEDALVFDMSLDFFVYLHIKSYIDFINIYIYI